MPPKSLSPDRDDFVYERRQTSGHEETREIIDEINVSGDQSGFRIHALSSTREKDTKGIFDISRVYSTSSPRPFSVTLSLSLAFSMKLGELG